eukprot:m.370070 g.370070  ORF g.370070 m.370070 type:complete len:104 (+) comp20858_c0_seq12:2318-2629(+)
MIPNKGAPYPCHRNQCPSRSTRVLRGETLDVRILVDRSVVEVFVMGGRIAWVHADPLFNETKTAVHLYNDGAHVVAASNVSIFGMGCGWRDDLPLPANATQAP